MKRFGLPLLFVGFVVTALAVAGYFVINYATELRSMNPAPFSYAELEKLEEKGAITDKEIPRLLACFERNDEDLRMKAAEALGKLGAKAVDPVRAKLEDKNQHVRYYAVQALTFMGPEAAAASDAVVARLADGDASVRAKAVYALGKIGLKSDSVVNGLLKALSDPDESVAETAAETLENFGTPSKEALPVLADLATNGATPAIRILAMKLLAQIGEPAMPALGELLKKTDPTETISLIQIIAPLGVQAKPLLPELQAFMIESNTWPDPDNLIGIFKKCGSDGVLGMTNILQTLHNPKAKYFAPNDERSKWVIAALGEMGADAKSAVPTLIQLLKDREPLRLEILDALGGIGPAAKDAIPHVEALLPTVPEARIALRRMGVIEKK